MTSPDATRHQPRPGPADAGSQEQPWWASGRDPEDGIDRSQDPLGAHRDARQGDRPRDDRDATADGGPRGGSEATRLATEALDLVGRLAAEASRRVADRMAGAGEGPPAGDREAADAWDRLIADAAPHDDGEVCNACPVCIGLRALRQVRPEVVAHLSDAAHHVSLALRALAEAQAGPRPGFEKIDLDQ